MSFPVKAPVSQVLLFLTNWGKCLSYCLFCGLVLRFTLASAAGSLLEQGGRQK